MSEALKYAQGRRHRQQVVDAKIADRRTSAALPFAKKVEIVLKLQRRHEEIMKMRRGLPATLHVRSSAIGDERG